VRRIIGGLALLAMLAATTASAQNPQSSQMTGASRIGNQAANGQAQGAADEPKAKANDKAYNAALKNLPDRQYDPWRGVR
jgi:hypothetical protein